MLLSYFWQTIQQDDLAGVFLVSIERMIAAEETQSGSSRVLLGDESNKTAQANWRSRLHAVVDRFNLPDFFLDVPLRTSTDDFASNQSKILVPLRVRITGLGAAVLVRGSGVCALTRLSF